MINTDEIPLVDLNEIDRVHLEEVELLNRLYALLDTQTSQKVNCEEGDATLYENKVLLTLNELLLHIREHFANEERLMKESYYPSYNMHKAEHGKIINEVQMKILEFRTRKDYKILREYFEEDIPTWLDQHIKSMDIILADFLKNRG